VPVAAEDRKVVLPAQRRDRSIIHRNRFSNLSQLVRGAMRNVAFISTCSHIYGSVGNIALTLVCLGCAERDALVWSPLRETGRTIYCREKSFPSLHGNGFNATILAQILATAAGFLAAMAKAAVRIPALRPTKMPARNIAG
jgi:hypothetical protein